MEAVSGLRAVFPLTGGNPSSPNRAVQRCAGKIADTTLSGPCKADGDLAQVLVPGFTPSLVWPAQELAFSLLSTHPDPPPLHPSPTPSHTCLCDLVHVLPWPSLLWSGEDMPYNMLQHSKTSARDINYPESTSGLHLSSMDSFSYS